MVIPVTDFKYDAKTGEFTCYGNVKHIVDNALDKAMNGCYQKSIDSHAAAGTMPKMLWSHNPYELPVGKWLSWEEDEKGLKLTGKLSKTVKGSDIEILAKDGALDSFSIGYIEKDAKWNTTTKCNELYEVDVKEVSWVNFACNEDSTLESIKSKMDDGKVPTKRELEKHLRESGLSKKQAEIVCSRYNDGDVKEYKSLDLKADDFKLFE